MTIFGRDASHYDASVSFGGLSFFTSKASEGTTLPDAKYATHMAAARAAGVPILGSYHVLRTPGNGGAGGLAQQLAYWVARQDAETPWWRTHPYWIMQIDAERWAYDQVSAANVLAFAALLARSGLPGWKVTYASRGQYGDSLKGLATPLWNAAYGQNTGAYPGDGAAAWAPYSGQTPVFLQYASKGYDHNAFRGSLDQLKALISPAPTPSLSEDDMGVIARDNAGQYYWCTGGFSHPVSADQVVDIRYLASQGCWSLATHAGGNNAEWTDDGGTRLGWSEAVFGPVWTPAGAVTVSVTQEQLDAAMGATASALAAALAGHIKVS